MRKTLVGFFWLIAASCALAQGIPGLAIPPGLIAGVTLIGTFNPSDKDAAVTLSNGNLTMANAGGTNLSARSTSSVAAGLDYFEVVISGSGVVVGVGTSAANLASYPGGADGLSVGYQAFDGSIYVSNSGTPSGLGSSSASDVIGVKVDRAGGTVAFNKNGGAFSATTALPAGGMFIMCAANSGFSATLNLTPTYPIPSGYIFWGN